MASKTESNNLKKVLSNTFCVIWCLALLALLVFCIYTDHHKMKIYFAGCVWDKSYRNIFLVWIGLFTSVMTRLHTLKNTTDTSKRKKLRMWLGFAGAWCILCAGFIVYDTIDNIQKNKQDYIAEINIDANDSILLVENYDKLSNGEQYNDITVYHKHGITLKRIDYFYESCFLNSSMIADSLYHWECSDNTITIQFDYGALKDSHKWANEDYYISPPEYIEKVYEINP